MSPTPGTIHRRARRDSGAARLWQWARRRRSPWTCPQAAEAADITQRRAREIVAALAAAGLVDQAREAELTIDGNQAAEWRLSEAARAVALAPVLVVDGTTGRIVGVRLTGDGSGTDRLRRAIERSGLSIRQAAIQLDIHERTLQRWLAQGAPIAADDPLIARARELRAAR
ncbi:MAG: hypothetical protein IT537_03315 [Hyphomicrobiales bacterium]|nr:hypothetical protein [Hyphomicrobiales bacterium]